MATKGLIRREHHRRTGEPLKGFALDLTVIAPEPGIFFLHDRFGQTNPMPFTFAEDVGNKISSELTRHAAEKWGDERLPVADDVYARIAAAQREPRSWLDQADALLEAADLVGPVFQARMNATLKLDLEASAALHAARLGGPALLLIGYAIEALAKGLIVARDPEASTSRWMNTHINAALLEAAKVPLEGGDKALAEKLYHHVKWIGRYPAPTPKDGRLFDEASRNAGHWMFGPGAIGPDDYRRAHLLCERIRDRLAELLDSEV